MTAKPRKVRVSSMTRRLLGHWERATPEVKSQGSEWYTLARRIIEGMAREYDVPVATAAGVVAALSPRLQWGPNLRAAREVLAGRRPKGVFRTSIAKAEAIADRRTFPYPLDVLRGPKVRAFCLALMGVESAAVVDTWVLKAVGFPKATPTDREYRLVADALRIAAVRAGTTTARLQAIAWVAVRGRAT